MKLFTSALSLALMSMGLANQAAGMNIPSGAQSIQPCSREIKVRKELRSLSSSEWQAYSDAVTSVYNDRWQDWFGAFHNRVAGTVHGNSHFFVFHRDYLNSYEKVLQGYNPSVTVPYWNIVIDYQDISRSAIFGKKYLGGNGESSDQCVKTGIAKAWELNLPDRHCLKRKYNNGQHINPCYSPEYVTSVMQTSKTYAKLRDGIENSVHGCGHLGVGGDMVTMSSPNDPLFMPHHANMDRIWAQWQAVSPDDRTYMYDGNDIAGKPVNVNDIIVGTDRPAYSVMRLGYGDMCYTYDTIQAANGDKHELLVKRGNNGGVKKCIQRSPAQVQAAHIVKVLPPKQLVTFYPAFANGTSHPLENELRGFSPLKPMAADGKSALQFKAPKPDEKFRGKMPHPSPLTDEWIKMQGASVEKVRALEKTACEMVTALNDAKYLSPYLYDPSD